MSLGKGFKGAFTMEGVGAFLAIFLMLAVLAYAGTTPSTVAASLKNRGA